jgi:Bacterial antitoxin of type II TA system, VapB
MHDDRLMRTTLDIDDDVLQAAKELGALHGKTAGQMVSELARKGLAPVVASRERNGVPLLPPRPSGRPRPTMRLVNELRDEA